MSNHETVRPSVRTASAISVKRRNLDRQRKVVDFRASRRSVVGLAALHSRGFPIPPESILVERAV
jgi:hypothetical protein